MKISPRILSALLFAILVPAFAQPAPEPTPAKTEPKKVEGMTIRVVCTNLSTNFQSPKWAMVGVNGEVASLNIIPWNISTPVLVPISGRILIYDQAALESSLLAKPKTLPRPLMDLSVPSGSKSCLIVAKPDGQQGFSCQIYDESTDQYAGGTRLFLNLSPYHISGVCGKATLAIPPLGASLVKPGLEQDGVRAVVQIYAALPTRKATALDEQWVFPKRSRGIVLIFEAEGGGIRVVGIPDEVPPEPAVPPKSKPTL